MKKEFTCKGCKNKCKVKFESEDGILVSIKGNKCKKGEKNALEKIEKKKDKKKGKKDKRDKKDKKKGKNKGKKK